MEYEVSGEDCLFDDSTNPSLAPVEPKADPAKPRDLLRKIQSGVLIPDEEPEHQLA